MKFYIGSHRFPFRFNFLSFKFRFFQCFTPHLIQFISRKSVPRVFYSKVPCDDPLTFDPSSDHSETENMERVSDSSVVSMNSDHKSLSCHSLAAGNGSNSNYGTLHLSSSSDLHREMRRRGQSPPRSISKSGEIRIQAKKIDRQSMKFLEDIFTSLLEVKWRWTLFAFCLSYFGSWTLFAVFWYAILYFHGDFEHFGQEGWSPCISGIDNFASAFLFSVETQHTTGYGFYHLTDQCSSAIILMCIQSIVGVILEGLMVGLVFVKMSRAKKRNATLMFSRNAVICQRDGQLCFMFRVADMRTKSHLLEAHVRAQVIKKRTTAEGEVINYHQEELHIKGDEEKDGRILLFWPTTMVHKIDSSSPLYKISPTDLNLHNLSFEVIVVLEGIVEGTGLTTQTRSSYLPSEILWGHRFESLTMSTKSSMSGERIVDYSLFHSTYPVTTTTLSAHELDTPISKP